MDDHKYVERRQEDIDIYNVVFRSLDSFIRDIDPDDVAYFLGFLARQGYQISKPQTYPKNTRDIVNLLVEEGELVTSNALGFHPEAHNRIRKGYPVLCYVLKEDLA